MTSVNLITASEIIGEKCVLGQWRDEIHEIRNGKVFAINKLPIQEFIQNIQLIDRHGNKWNKNTIMDINSALLATLYVGLSGFYGLTYMALGNGDPAWDTSPTIPPVTTSEDTLLTEYYRKALDSVIFLDGSDNPFTYTGIGDLPALKLIRKIESTCTYLESEANNQSIREFALFGGNATATLDSGLISNTIRHREIYKTDAIRLIRRVRYSLG